MSAPHILVCDDDEFTFKTLTKALPKLQLSWAANGDAAVKALKERRADLLLLDISIRTEDEGLRFLPIFRSDFPDVPVIMLSGKTDFESVRKALTLGAMDFLSKGADPNEIQLALEKALIQRARIKETLQLGAEVAKTHAEHQMIGKSAAIADLRKKIEKLKSNPVNILIQGEPGTGKEIVARQLRKTGPNGALEPFVSVDSSTIHATTAEGILFGHEKGAFTGADKTKKGLFEEADGGIIYFDEIGNMSLEIQAKLLRVLQEKEVLRLGSARPIPLTFRVVAATNKDLSKMVKAGQFREDLLERIGVVPLEVPPLRERFDDLPLLTAHFLSRLPGKRTLSEEVQKLFAGYRWPGNVRELGNVLTYVTALSESQTIEIADLPPKIRDMEGEVFASEESKTSFYEQVKAFEKDLLQKEYKKAGGKVATLAKNLGMDRSHLHQKLKALGIH